MCMWLCFMYSFIFISLKDTLYSIFVFLFVKVFLGGMDVFYVRGMYACLVAVFRLWGCWLNWEGKFKMLNNGIKRKNSIEESDSEILVLVSDRLTSLYNEHCIHTSVCCTPKLKLPYFFFYFWLLFSTVAITGDLARWELESVLELTVTLLRRPLDAFLFVS